MSVECTYMEGSLPGVVTWSGKACGVVSHGLLNNTLDDTVLTTQYSEYLEDVPMEVWRGQGRRRGRGGGPRLYKANKRRARTVG